MKLSKKIKLSLAAAGSVMISANAVAATETFPVGFTTVPDITVTELSGMDFGAGLFLAANSSCDLLVTDHSGTGYPGDAALRISRTSDEAADVGYLDLGTVSSDCIADPGDHSVQGVAGIYEIGGVAGGVVKVTVETVSAGTNLNYTPTGCVTTYNGGANADLCETLANAQSSGVTLASAADTVSNTGLGSPVPGKAYIALGGTITSVNSNVAGAALVEPFTITVTY